MPIAARRVKQRQARLRDVQSYTDVVGKATVFTKFPEEEEEVRSEDMPAMGQSKSSNCQRGERFQHRYR